MEHRDGTSAFKLAPLEKSIYSLHTLRELMLAANMRYLEFISTLDDPQDGIRAVDKVTRPVRQDGRSYKGSNFLLEDDIDALLAVIAGQNAIGGFRSRDLTQALPDLCSSQRSRLIKRLRSHGIIKRKLLPSVVKSSIELLFKEWKSHASLRKFDTSMPALAEGMLWANLI